MPTPYTTKTYDELLTDFQAQLVTIFAAAGYSADVWEGTPLVLIGKPYLALLDEIYYALDRILEQRDVRTATGVYLDAIGYEVGLTRIPAVEAAGTVTFARATAAGEDYLIPTGTEVSTVPDSAGAYTSFVTTAPVTLLTSTTSIAAPVEAVVAGTGGNLAATTVTNIVTAVAGIETVSNAAPMTGGVDEETDTAFRVRVIYRMQNPIEGGTASDFHNWALELAGTSNAAVLEGYRTGASIDVLFLFNAAIPTTPQRDAMQVWLDSKKFLTADLYVRIPTAYTVPVTAVITEYATGYVEATVRAAVEAALEDFFPTILLGADGGKVRVTDIEDVIKNTPGVLDFTMAAPAANYTLANIEAAVLGTVTIT